MEEDKLKQLIHAAKNGHLTDLQQLIAEGVGVDRMLSDGSTALFHAARNGHTEIIKLLLTEKANVNIEVLDESEDAMSISTPLTVAAQFGHTEIIKLLLEAKADINALTLSVESALVQAMESGYQTVVHQLLDAGADIGNPEDMIYVLKNTQSSVFWTAALIAGFNMQPDHRRKLLESEPDFCRRVLNVQKNLKRTLDDFLKGEEMGQNAPNVLQAVQKSLFLQKATEKASTPTLTQRSDPNDIQNLKQFLWMREDRSLSEKDKATNRTILTCIQAKEVPNEIVSLIREHLSDEAWIDLLCRDYSLNQRAAKFIFYGIQTAKHPLSRFIAERWIWDFQKGPWVAKSAPVPSVQCGP